MARALAKVFEPIECIHFRPLIFSMENYVLDIHCKNLGPCGFAKIDYATLKLAYKPVGSMYGLFS